MTDERELFLQNRRTGIGGSDVAPILGLSQWSTPLDVYLEKLGELPPKEETQPMRWGKLLEPLVRQEYAERTGRIVRLPGLIRRPGYDWQLANVDGVSELPDGSDRRIFEAKTARTAEGWGDELDNVIPTAYYLQVQHYMLVTAIPIADVSVLIGGSDFRTYVIERNDEVQELLMEEEQRFWNSVINRVPPPATTVEEVQRKFKMSIAGKSAVVGDVTVLEAVQQLREISVQRKALDDAETKAKVAVLEAIGDAEQLVDADGRVLATWKASKSRDYLDLDRIRKEIPDIYAQYLKPPGDPVRRFLLK